MKEGDVLHYIKILIYVLAALRISERFWKIRCRSVWNVGVHKIWVEFARIMKRNCAIACSSDSITQWKRILSRKY